MENTNAQTQTTAQTQPYARILGTGSNQIVVILDREENDVSRPTLRLHFKSVSGQVSTLTMHFDGAHDADAIARSHFDNLTEETAQKMIMRSFIRQVLSPILQDAAGVALGRRAA